MTARCGSNDHAHRTRTCRACNKLYETRHTGRPKFLYRVRATAAHCAVCGIVGGNSLDVPVYRYALKRHHKRTSMFIGTIGLCDSCVVVHAELKDKFRKTA